MDSLGLCYPLALATDSTHGFTRPGMGKVKLAGSVDAYDRHMFVCYKNREVWPPRFDMSTKDPLPMLLETTVKSRNNDITIETQITICESREEAGFLDGDVLIFPEMIKYRGLKESNVDSFVEDVMVNGKPWSAGVQYEIAGSHVFVCAHASRDTRCGFCGPILADKFNEEIVLRGLKNQESNIDSFVEDVMVNGKPWSAGVRYEIAGSHVFVCAHASRDTRCGFCGPILVDKFNEEIVLRGLKDQVFVWACSHVGGHGYAGNAIIFSPGSDGKITGHWYGYVTPNDVPQLLDHHIVKGEVIRRLWRGKMGTSIEDVNWIDDQEVTDNENVGGCCKGVDGVSCCINPSSEKTQGLSWRWPLFEEHIAVGVFGIVVAATVAYKIYRSLNHTG